MENGESHTEYVTELLEMLNDCEDVQQVHHNGNIPDEEVEAYSA